MTVVVLIVVALALVIGLGWLIVFSLMKRGQDRPRGRRGRPGQPVTESQDTPPEPQRDAAGFEKVLDESLDDLHPERE
jgi:hypothetical protein